MKINDEGRTNAAYWYKRAMKVEAQLQKVMARCADLLDEDHFNELDAMTTEGSAPAKKHNPECSYWDGLMAQVCNCGATTIASIGERDATSAQLDEAQRFLHSAPGEKP